MKKNPELTELLSITDIEIWLADPAWTWFKSYCAKQCEIKKSELLSLNPSLNPHAISYAQGFHSATSAIAHGVETASGLIPFEEVILTEFENQLKANGEIPEIS